MNSAIADHAKKIRALILDVDGVFTDGRFYLAPNGGEIKCFHTHDGVGLKRLQKNGIIIAVISGRSSETVKHRMHELGIQHVYQGIERKITTYHALISRLTLRDDQVAYMGDDLPDLEIIERVGLGIAPANAVQEVKNKAVWVTERDGGNAAIREVCDFILLAQQNRLPDED